MTPKEFTEQFLKEKGIKEYTIFTAGGFMKLSYLISETLTAYKEATKPDRDKLYDTIDKTMASNIPTSGYVGYKIVSKLTDKILEDFTFPKVLAEQTVKLPDDKFILESAKNQPSPTIRIIIVAAMGLTREEIKSMNPNIKFTT